MAGPFHGASDDRAFVGGFANHRAVAGIVLADDDAIRNVLCHNSLLAWLAARDVLLAGTDSYAQK
jgi:hypothetical protein